MRLHANKYVEALLYITIPLAVHVALTPKLLRRAVCRTKALLAGAPDHGYVVREISATTIVTTWYPVALPDQELNQMLQRAIVAHLAGTIRLEASRTNTVYRLLDKPSAEIAELVRAKAVEEDSEKSDAGTEDEDSDGEGESANGYTYDQLLKLQVTAAPAAETWAEVESGVFFQYVVAGNGDSLDDEPSNDPEMKRVTVTFRFRSKRKDASQAIDQLVKDAFLSYKKRQILDNASDAARYMFVQTVQEMMAPSSDAGSGSNGAGADATLDTVKKLVFKRYRLGDDKTFRNLFFQEKARVLNLLDNFTERRGKFAVKGFPYKLGLLLHGPPGTGKTSLIKVVAQHTKRHIVSISLAKIQTNQELMDAMFDLRFPVKGREMPILLDFQDVVFVLEDIDCASASVVHARVSNDETIGQKPERIRRRSGAGTATANDKLNLSGLLNVLDGVIDCPGRIVIMTTNHPEKLDPALIRPGRVNAQLLLGPMEPVQVVEMLEYYFSATLTVTERKQVEESVQNASFTPAEVEEVCAEYDAVEEAIAALKKS